MMEQCYLTDAASEYTYISFTHHLQVVLIIQFTTAAVPISACRRRLLLGDSSLYNCLKLMFFNVSSVFSFILKSCVHALSRPSCYCSS